MLVSVENLYLDNGSLEFNLTGIYLLHYLTDTRLFQYEVKGRCFGSKLHLSSP